MKKILLFVLLSFCLLINTISTPAQTGVEEILDKSSFVEITLPENTIFETKVLNTINTKTSKTGEKILFELETNYIENNNVIISKKSKFKGTLKNIKKTSLIGNTYEINVDITRLSIPFKGDYKIEAHAEFNLKKHKKKKGFIFSLKTNQSSKDLLDDTRTDKQSEKEKEERLNAEEDPPIIINEQDKVKIILDKPFTIIIKQ